VFPATVTPEFVAAGSCWSHSGLPVLASLAWTLPSNVVEKTMSLLTVVDPKAGEAYSTDHAILPVASETATSSPVLVCPSCAASFSLAV
jgi:hypothetical protein